MEAEDGAGQPEREREVWRWKSAETRKWRKGEGKGREGVEEA